MNLLYFFTNLENKGGEYFQQSSKGKKCEIALKIEILVIRFMQFSLYN